MLWSVKGARMRLTSMILRSMPGCNGGKARCARVEQQVHSRFALQDRGGSVVVANFGRTHLPADWRQIEHQFEGAAREAVEVPTAGTNLMGSEPTNSSH